MTCCLFCHKWVHYKFSIASALNIFFFFFFFFTAFTFFYYITGLTESIVPCSSQHSGDQSHETAVLAAVCDTYSYVTGSGKGHFTDRFLVRQTEMLWWWLLYYGYTRPITIVWIWNGALAFGLIAWPFAAALPFFATVVRDWAHCLSKIVWMTAKK